MWYIAEICLNGICEVNYWMFIQLQGQARWLQKSCPQRYFRLTNIYSIFGALALTETNKMVENSMGICIGVCLGAVWTPPHNSIQPIGLLVSLSVSVSVSVNASLYIYQFELILYREFHVKYFSTCICCGDFFVVAGHTVECIKYDVSSQPVSIHVPVTRLLAGLLAQISRWDVPIGLKELHHKVTLVTRIHSSGMRTNRCSGRH